MSDCRFGVSPVNYPDPDPDPVDNAICKAEVANKLSSDADTTFIVIQCLTHGSLCGKIIKRVGESRHLCRTPIVVLNHSPVLPLNRTALWALSYRFSMARMMLALMLYFLIVAHKASCHTLSKAFLKSMKTC